MKGKGRDCDIVFLSYAEPCAEEHFQLLLSRYPRAKRLHGVRGVGRANKMTAEVVDTDYYFIVDADNILKSDFDIDDVSLPSEAGVIKIWSCENAVNGLVYGYGGVKLCFRESVRALRDDNLDVFGTGNRELAFDRTVASLTKFNTSAYDAWKGGFRECCVLQAGSGIEMLPEKSAQKIAIWTTVGQDKPYGEWAIRGAIEGRNYARLFLGDLEQLKKINDPEWLLNKFKESHSEEI